MRIGLLSANLGNYDPVVPWPDQVVPGSTVEIHRFTDDTLPPRPLAMTSRLLAGVPKWWGGELVPGCDIYVWCDASCCPNPGAVAWFVEQLGDAEAAFFQHPERHSVREEYEFIKARMARPGETYLTSRYRDEYLSEQYRYIMRHGFQYADTRLFASTAFIYRPTIDVLRSFKDVWMCKTRFLLHDQLALPWALWVWRVQINVIPDNYLKCPHLTFTRKQKGSA